MQMLKSEIRNVALHARIKRQSVWDIRDSDLGFVSDFELRISDFTPYAKALSEISFRLIVECVWGNIVKTETIFINITFPTPSVAVFVA